MRMKEEEMLLNKWKPIETAPKDTCPILVSDTEAGICVARQVFNDFFGTTAWVSNGIYVDPTHWMPLPPAPKEYDE